MVVGARADRRPCCVADFSIRRSVFGVCVCSRLSGISGGFLLSERERVAGSVAGGLSYSGRRRSAIRRSVRRPARVYPFLFAESVALPVDRRFPVVELRTGDALALCEAGKRRATAGFEQEPATAVLRDGRTRSLSFLGPRSTCPDLSPERSGRRSRMPRHLLFTSFSGTA